MSWKVNLKTKSWLDIRNHHEYKQTVSEVSEGM